jgi:hypothetical protein
MPESVLAEEITSIAAESPGLGSLSNTDYFDLGAALMGNLIFFTKKQVLGGVIAGVGDHR